MDKEEQKTIEGTDGRKAEYDSENYLLLETGKEIAGGNMPDEELDPEGLEETRQQIIHWVYGGALPENAVEKEEEEAE